MVQRLLFLSRYLTALSLSYPRPGPMNQTPRCAYMLLLVHVTMCLSISNGYVRLLLWLHPVPVHPIRTEMEIFKRNAMPAHMQGNKSEDGNRDKTEMMEMDTICVCCCCFARFICLCGAFPMFPKHYTPSAGCPKHVKLLRSTRCKNRTHSPKTDQWATSKQMPAFTARPQPPDAFLLLPSVSVPCRKVKDQKKKSCRADVSMMMMMMQDDAKRYRRFGLVR